MLMLVVIGYNKMFVCLVVWLLIYADATNEEKVKKKNEGE